MSKEPGPSQIFSVAKVKPIGCESNHWVFGLQQKPPNEKDFMAQNCFGLFGFISNHLIFSPGFLSRVWKII
jgi:hypothetical protein